MRRFSVPLQYWCHLASTDDQAPFPPPQQIGSTHAYHPWANAADKSSRSSPAPALHPPGPPRCRSPTHPCLHQLLGAADCTSPAQVVIPLTRLHMSLSHSPMPS